MKAFQKQVEEITSKMKRQWTPEFRFIHLVEEFGELADVLLAYQGHKNENAGKEKLMEASKIKEIENKLYQLIAQTADQTKKEKSPAKLSSSGVRVIRRRKGKPDFPGW